MVYFEVISLWLMVLLTHLLHDQHVMEFVGVIVSDGL